MSSAAPRLRRLATDELSDDERRDIRALLEAAFEQPDPEERFNEHDWQHALGGTHVVLDEAGAVVAHASVVEREIHADGRPLHTGYVEAVATSPARQGQGLGTVVMEDATALILDVFELGALGTGAQHFYERLGWRTWRGPTAVRAPGGDRPTPDDDGFVMILRTPTTPELDDTGPITCDWRPGDAW